MAHLTQKELVSIISNAKKRVSAGSKYYHYKHPEQHYEILAVGLLEAKEKPCIVYKALYGEGIVWVRDIDNFLEKIETQNGKVRRFSLVEAP